MAEPLCFRSVSAMGRERGRHVPACQAPGKGQQNNNGRHNDGVHGQDQGIHSGACGCRAGSLRVSGGGIGQREIHHDRGILS